MRYAENTNVSAENSRSEIERILQRYGATSFMYGWEGTKAILAFQIEKRQIRIVIDMPDRNEQRFRLTPTGRQRKDSGAITEAWEQATRQRWRALALVVKAKLEAVDSQITTIENEFLGYIVLPNGKTINETLAPQLAHMYEHGSMPKLLPEMGDPNGHELDDDAINGEVIL